MWIAFPEGDGAEADFIWRAHSLIVEADGRDPHTVRKAFNADRRRDARLMLLGWRVVRFTWQQVTFEPAYVAATLRGLLQRSGRVIALEHPGEPGADEHRHRHDVEAEQHDRQQQEDLHRRQSRRPP